MSSTSSKKSADTGNYLVMPDGQNIMLEEAFWRLKTGLQHQLEHLRSLESALYESRDEDLSAATFLPTGPLSPHHSTRLIAKHQAWKDGRRALDKSVVDFEEEMDAQIYHLLHTKDARPQQKNSRKRDSISPGRRRGGIIDFSAFEHPRKAPRPATKRVQEHLASPSPFPSPAFIASETPLTVKPGLAPSLSAPRESEKVSVLSTPDVEIVLLRGCPQNLNTSLLPEEHTQMAKTSGHLTHRDGKKTSRGSPDFSVLTYRNASSGKISLANKNCSKRGDECMDASGLSYSVSTDRYTKSSVSTPIRPWRIAPHPDVPPTPPRSARRTRLPLPTIRPSASGYFRDVDQGSPSLLETPVRPDRSQADDVARAEPFRQVNSDSSTKFRRDLEASGGSLASTDEKRRRSRSGVDAGVRARSGRRWQRKAKGFLRRDTRKVVTATV